MTWQKEAAATTAWICHLPVLRILPLLFGSWGGMLQARQEKTLREEKNWEK